MNDFNIVLITTRIARIENRHNEVRNNVRAATTTTTTTNRGTSAEIGRSAEPLAAGEIPHCRRTRAHIRLRTAFSSQDRYEIAAAIGGPRGADLRCGRVAG